MYDVFCYGVICLDISGRLESPRIPFGQASAIDYHINAGGDAALVSMMLSSLGLKVGLAGGPIGDDPMGEHIRKTLERNGVEVLAETMGKTSIAAIVVDETGQRSSLTFHDSTPIEKIPVPEEAIAGSKYLYCDGAYGQNCTLAGKIAKKHGIPSLLNYDMPSRDSIYLYDTVIAGEITSRWISDDPLEASSIIYDLNRGTSIVTMGENGCICNTGEVLTLPAYRVNAIDTTGAGAAFAAGFISSRISGLSLLDSLKMGSAAGAIKSTVKGSLKLFEPGEIGRFVDARSRQIP